MGTPLASASLDQMRNVQRTASCGGEREREVALVEIKCRLMYAGLGMIAAMIVAHVAFNSGAEPLFASGCDAGAVFFCDVAQQVLFAQQPGWHAF